MRPSTQAHPPTHAVRKNRPRTAQPAHQYVYAIIEGAPHGKYDGVGIEGSPLEFICGREVTSVVSALGQDRIRPERRYLAAHRDVLRRLVAQERAVLPICFGTIASGPDEIAAMLTRNRAALARQLKRVGNKVEMGLRTVWEVPNIFDYFVTIKPELRAARDRVFGRNGKPSQDQQIELGRVFERLLAQERDLHTDTVEEALEQCCAEIKRNAVRDEREVMNLACLIDRDGQARFEAAVFTAASHFDNNFAFDYSGPWAPHSFAEMDLKISARE